ncbi:MAG TPA: hypothetical protein VHE81_00610 [Lacipirellulaceae bacterium]|nr:hypothetical protein [Lacipirellulaceae bacterium]
MNSDVPRLSAMQYRDQEFRYDAELLMELESQFVRELSGGKQYRQKRSGHSKRRKSPKASHPGYGFAGRRNRKWNW